MRGTALPSGEFDYAGKLAALLLLAGGRTSEVRLATWDEVKDLDGDTARIEVPEDRMKMRSPWAVPLSRQATALLRELWANAEEYERIEPQIFYRYSGAGAGVVCSENAVNDFLARAGLHDALTGTASENCLAQWRIPSGPITVLTERRPLNTVSRT